MSADITIEAKGLSVAQGQLKRGGGALVQADNVNVEAPGVIRKRRGLLKTAAGFGGPIWKMVGPEGLGTNMLINRGTSAVANALVYGSVAGATTLAGTVTNQPDTRMAAAVGSNGCIYVTSDECVRRVDQLGLGLGVLNAGAPQGLPLDRAGPAAVLTSPSGSWLLDGYGVRYRVVWYRLTTQGQEIVGAPSASTIIANVSGTSGYAAATTRSVTARVVIPAQVNAAATQLVAGTDRFRLYRSRSFLMSASDPDDELRLVFDGGLTAGNISMGYVDVVDTVADAIRGSNLYTNPNSGEDGFLGRGIINANNPPPWCREVEQYAGCTWYAQQRSRGSIEVSLVAVAGAPGANVLAPGDTITVGFSSPFVLTAVALAPPGANQFVVAIVGTLSQNLRETCLNICEAINKSASNGECWAYYVSGQVGQPGRIVLQSRLPTGTVSISSASAGDAFRPQCVSALTGVFEDMPNALSFSKPLQPDAVPVGNTFKVGRSDTKVLRCKTYRDALYVFTSSGLYRVLGNSFESFSLQEFDLTCKLLARESVFVLDDAIYAWCTGGVARITDAGVQYISLPIEPLLHRLRQLWGDTLINTNAFALATKLDHRYILFAPSQGGTGQLIAYVYDTRMQAWTTWSFNDVFTRNGANGFSTGCVRDVDDALFLGGWNSSSGDSWLFQERRTFTVADFADSLDGNVTTDIPVISRVRWNAHAAAGLDAVHWQEVQLTHDDALGYPLAAATSVQIGFISEVASGPSVTVTTQSTKSRVLVPQSVRRGQRMSVTMLHGTQGDFVGIASMKLLAEAYSQRVSK